MATGAEAEGPQTVRRAADQVEEGWGLARAAREMWRHIPTEEQIESGNLDGTFTTPADIVAFEAKGIRLGEEAMLRPEWEGIMHIDE